MNKTYKIFLAAAILFSFHFSNINSIKAQDAVYNLIRHQYTVNSDGSIDMRFRKEIKLLRNRAITAYADKGETFILYNPAYDKLTINESYTIRKDGSKVITPANAFIDQLPSECTDCGRYNGIRERVVVHTGLEYDCIIVLDYTIHHKGNSGWTETLDLVKDCPVKKFEAIIDAPSNAKWNATLKGDNSKTKKINDSHAYHLVASDLEQSIIENYAVTDYPRITIDIAGSKSTSTTKRSTPLPEVNDLIAELIEHDSLSWATNIRDYVADNVRTVKISPRYVDNQSAPARETFASNCGTLSEKNELLAAILLQAGFKAENCGEAGVNLTVKGTTYTITAANKSPFVPKTAATDKGKDIKISRQLPWKGIDMGGGYQQMTIPTEANSINIDPARLTSERKSSLQVGKHNEQYDYIITVPEGSRLVKPVNIGYSKKGIGTIKISISQLADGKIAVKRYLVISVNDGVVTTKQYKAFRKMMQDWKHHNSILLATAKK